MALFQGEQLVDIVTPDGRAMKVPASVAQGLQIQQTPAAGGVPQANPMPTAQAPTTADVPPDSVTGGQLPSAQNPYVLPDTNEVPRNSADFVVPDPTVAAQRGAPARAKQAKKDAAAQKAVAAAAASPQGQRAASEQQTQGAYGNEAQATLDASTVEAATNDMLGNAAAEHNQKINTYLDQKAAAAQQAVADEQKKNDEILALRKKIASTKIDRKADHPVLAALSIALAGLGSAMQNRYTNQAPSTAALDTFWKALDRKVQNQMADLDLMEKDYGMAKDELSSLKDMGGRKLELYNTLVAGEADKAKRHLEEIVAKSASEKTKANAKIMMAQIDERAAAAHQDAMRWGQEYDQRDAHQKQQMNLGWAQYGETRRSNMANEQLKREDMYLDSQKYMAGLKAKGDEEAYKAALKQQEEVSKRGIRDSNGDLFLMPGAKGLLDQANQLEAQAQQLEEAGKADPLSFGIKGGKQAVEMYRERASQLRGQANQNAVLGFNDTDATKVSDLLAAGQGTVQLIDRIKALADKAGRAGIERDAAQAELQSMFNQLGPNLKEAWQLGAWDKGSANLVQSIIGQDPSSEWNAGVLSGLITGKMFNDPQAFKKQLDSVADGLEDRAKNTLIHRGAKFGKDQRVLQRLESVDPNSPTGKAAGSLEGSTVPGQAEKIAGSGGAAAKIVDTLTIGKGPLSSREEQATAFENNQPISTLSRYGLNEKQVTGFDSLLKSYKAGNAKDGDQIVASIANNAVQNPDTAVALLRNLQEYAPDLYTKARMTLPPGGPADEQMTYIETSRIGNALLLTPQIMSEVISTMDDNGKITNQDGWKELARRARAGDPDAKKAILEIARHAGVKSAAPDLRPLPGPKSVVKENR